MILQYLPNKVFELSIQILVDEPIIVMPYIAEAEHCEEWGHVYIFDKARVHARIFCSMARLLKLLQ